EVSARIVQVVTAEAVAVLKGEQEKEAQHKHQPAPLPLAVEETANLPPSPPPSPASEQTGTLEEGPGGKKNNKCIKVDNALTAYCSLQSLSVCLFVDEGAEDEVGPLHSSSWYGPATTGKRHKFLTPSISVSVPDDEPYNSDEEYYEHPLFSSEWTDAGTPLSATAQSAEALLDHEEVLLSLHVSILSPFLPSTHPKEEEEEEEETVKEPVADEPKPAVPLGEELEKISGPAEPLHQAGDSREAQQEPVPEDQVARNGESVTIVQEEPSQAKMPSLGEEGVQTTTDLLTASKTETRDQEGTGLFAAEPLDTKESEKGSKTSEQLIHDALVPQPAKTETVEKAESQSKEEKNLPDVDLMGEKRLHQEQKDLSIELHKGSKADEAAIEALPSKSADDVGNIHKSGITSPESIGSFLPSEFTVTVTGMVESAFSSDTSAALLHKSESEDSKKTVQISITTEIAKDLSRDHGTDKSQTKKQEEEFAAVTAHVSKPVTEQTPTQNVPFWEEEKDMTEDESDEERYSIPREQKPKGLDYPIDAKHDQRTTVLDKEADSKRLSDAFEAEELEISGASTISDIKKEENHRSADRFNQELFPEKLKEPSERAPLSPIEKTPVEPLQEKDSGKSGKEEVFCTADSGTHKMLEEDKSGMSKYFETSTLKDEAIKSDVLQQGSDYYELSDTKEQSYDPYHKDFLVCQKDAEEFQPEAHQCPNAPAHEIGYSTLAQGFQDNKAEEPSSPTERMYTIDPNVYGDKRELHNKNKDDLTLSRSLGLGGRSAIEQRSMSINLPMSCLDSIALGFNFGRAHDLSPLGSDILDNASEDEGDDYLPATTPAMEKAPSFPTDSREEDDQIEESKVIEGGDIQVEPLSESPFLAKDYYKNGTVMAPDLPEMLDLAGTRSRLASVSADAEAAQRKSGLSDTVVEDDGATQHLVANENHMTLKADSQLEDLGYCVFNKYTVPMPSPVQDSENLTEESCLFDEKIRRGVVTDLSLIEVKLAAAERAKEERDISGDSVILGKEFEQERKALDKLDTVLEKSEEHTDSKEVYLPEDTEHEGARLVSTFESADDNILVGLEDKVLLSEKKERGAQLDKAEISCKPDYDAIKHDMDSAARQVEQEYQSKLAVHISEFVSEHDSDNQEKTTLSQDPSICAKVEPSYMKDATKLSEIEVKEKGPKPDLVHQEAVDKEESYESSGDNDQGQEGLPGETSKPESVSVSEEETAPQLLVEESAKQTDISKVTQEETTEIQMENIPQPEEDNVELAVPVKTEDLPCDLIYEKVRRDEGEQHEDKRRLDAEYDDEQREENEEEIKQGEKHEEESKVEDKHGEEITEKEKHEEQNKEEEMRQEQDEQTSKERDLEKPEEEVCRAVPEEVPELKGVIESVVTIEDDFITIVQTTVDDGESASHSVRFAEVPQAETGEGGFHHEEEVEVVSDAHEETKESSLEAPGSPEREDIPLTDYKTETYDDYKDETTIDDSILDTDSIWVDTQDDDRSIMTEQLETVPKEEKAERELRRPSLDKHKKEKPLKTGRGRISTPERKIAKKEPSTVSRDEVRRKKAVYKKAELAKKAEVQAHSPSRKIILKPAIKHTRPTHHSCVKRKQTGDCAVLNFCNVAGKHRHYYCYYYHL
ncbi:hypothetical protein lerEdw1_004374, partial [Lerista edwardsae]